MIKAVSHDFFARIYLFLVCFSVFGHLVSSSSRLNPGWIAPLAAFLTLAMGLVTCQFDFLKSGKGRALACSTTVLVLGATSEILGISTGFPFGKYRYTEAWWPAIPLGRHGFYPLLLPFAWLMIVGAAAFSGRATRSKILNALLAALLATGLDLVMEGTLAGKLGYWKWKSQGPLPGHSPWSNSIAWFAISFLASLILYTPGSFPRSSRSGWIVLGGQAVLMFSLRYP